jgi:transcriptional regulator with XRE-family HTH domain
MQTNPLALFGDHLARLRKARGWSQEKLALESGLARSYVSGIERGRRNVALVNICVLADTLGVPTSEMLRFTPTPPGTEDTTPSTDHTPLPQISRSLCRLENRDQVWLAEVIRSLSSRLSNCTPPEDDSPTPPTSTSDPLAAANDDGEDADDGNDDSDCNDDEDIDFRGRIDDTAGTTAQTSSPSSSPVGEPRVHTSVDTGFEAGFPVRRTYASAGNEGYRNLDEDLVRVRDPQRGASDAPHASPMPELPARSETTRHDDSPRPPTNNED